MTLDTALSQIVQVMDPDKRQSTWQLRGHLFFNVDYFLSILSPVDEKEKSHLLVNKIPRVVKHNKTVVGTEQNSPSNTDL